MLTATCPFVGSLPRAIIVRKITAVLISIGPSLGSASGSVPISPRSCVIIA